MLAMFCCVKCPRLVIEAYEIEARRGRCSNPSFDNAQAMFAISYGEKALIFRLAAEESACISGKCVNLSAANDQAEFDRCCASY